MAFADGPPPISSGPGDSDPDPTTSALPATTTVTTALPPAPPAGKVRAAPARLRLPSSTRIRRGRATVAVSCTAAAACAGRASLYVGSRLVGRGPFALKPGARATLTIKLTHRPSRRVTALRLKVRFSDGRTSAATLKLRR